jgi:hypothetical protein
MSDVLDRPIFDFIDMKLSIQESNQTVSDSVKKWKSMK